MQAGSQAELGNQEKNSNYIICLRLSLATLRLGARLTLFLHQIPLRRFFDEPGP
jgi:hypothetical protein